MPCNNEVEQVVPTQFDAKIVKGRCGQTGYYGTPIFCEKCEKSGEAQRERRRIDDLDRDYDNW